MSQFFSFGFCDPKNNVSATISGRTAVVLIRNEFVKLFMCELWLRYVELFPNQIRPPRIYDDVYRGTGHGFLCIEIFQL